MRTPRTFGDKQRAPFETFTEAYPHYGEGGAQQLIPSKITDIKADEVDILPKN